MKYKVILDYKNFIPINETELNKAMTAFLNGNGAVFENGATDKIYAILPDFHAIMGYNYGYELQPEDWAEIGASKQCATAKQLIAEMKLRLQGKTPERKEITSGVKMLAEKMKP